MIKRDAQRVVVSTIHMPPALHQTVKDVCVINGWSLRWFVTQSLREKLAALAAKG